MLATCRGIFSFPLFVQSGEGHKQQAHTQKSTNREKPSGKESIHPSRATKTNKQKASGIIRKILFEVNPIFYLTLPFAGRKRRISKERYISSFVKNKKKSKRNGGSICEGCGRSRNRHAHRKEGENGISRRSLTATQEQTYAGFIRFVFG